MTNKLAFEVVDRTLHDLTNRNESFGGIVFVMSGDFRQVLPVIPRGSHADIVSASINNSYLWESVEVFCLSENMRAGDAVVVHPDLENRTFADWLLCLGNNELETIDEDYIKCPDMMKLPLRTHEPWLWPSTLNYTRAMSQTSICVSARFWLLTTRRFP
jgi:ATP-dependent DNA helicase PIF1